MPIGRVRESTSENGFRRKEVDLLNIKELWAYRNAVFAVRRALDDLTEYEAKIYAPNGARCDGMPFETVSDNDRLAPIAEKHAELKRKLMDAKLEAHSAYVMLEAFETILVGDECDVLDLRYRKWMSTRDISSKLHRSERTIKRITNRIKEKFSKF